MKLRFIFLYTVPRSRDFLVLYEGMFSCLKPSLLDGLTGLTHVLKSVEFSGSYLS